MSKIPPIILHDAIHAILTDRKPRNFKESIDLQVNLKNYDPAKDRRFAGQVRLPHPCRPTLRVCILCDLAHETQAQRLGIASMNVDALKKLNKNKKLVKKMCSDYDALLASESIIKMVPRLVGPYLSRINKFPVVVGQGDSLTEKVAELRATVKFQLKKVLCLGCCIGHVDMGEEAVRQNCVMALNFFVSLLKKNWQNLRSAYIRTTMGKPQRIY
jgi:large subunit ribosomal protein L10Ae